MVDFKKGIPNIFKKKVQEIVIMKNLNLVKDLFGNSLNILNKWKNKKLILNNQKTL